MMMFPMLLSSLIMEKDFDGNDYDSRRNVDGPSSSQSTSTSAAAEMNEQESQITEQEQHERPNGMDAAKLNARLSSTIGSTRSSTSSSQIDRKEIMLLDGSDQQQEDVLISLNGNILAQQGAEEDSRYADCYYEDEMTNLWADSPDPHPPHESLSSYYYKESSRSRPPRRRPTSSSTPPRTTTTTTTSRRNNMERYDNFSMNATNDNSRPANLAIVVALIVVALYHFRRPIQQFYFFHRDVTWYYTLRNVCGTLLDYIIGFGLLLQASIQGTVQQVFEWILFIVISLTQLLFGGSDDEDHEDNRGGWIMPLLRRHRRRWDPHNRIMPDLEVIGEEEVYGNQYPTSSYASQPGHQSNHNGDSLQRHAQSTPTMDQSTGRTTTLVSTNRHLNRQCPKAELEPAFLRDEDYPPDWLVYHPRLGVVAKTVADAYEQQRQQQQQSPNALDQQHSLQQEATSTTPPRPVVNTMESSDGTGLEADATLVPTNSLGETTSNGGVTSNSHDHSHNLSVVEDETMVDDTSCRLNGNDHRHGGTGHTTTTTTTTRSAANSNDPNIRHSSSTDLTNNSSLSASSSSSPTSASSTSGDNLPLQRSIIATG